MYFDLDILFKGDNPPTADILYKTIVVGYVTELDLSLKEDYAKHQIQAVPENPYCISLPSTFWRRHHTINFYKDLISILRKNHLVFKEIFMNLEDSEWFLSEKPPKIEEEKTSFPDPSRGYYYYMPGEEFRRQNIFRTQLVFCTFVPEDKKESIDYHRMHPDWYKMIEIDGGYRSESLSLTYFIGEIGYFRYIHKSDIDPRIITAIQQTKEYLVELDEHDWYFIFKYEIDDFKKNGKNGETVSSPIFRIYNQQ